MTIEYLLDDENKVTEADAVDAQFYRKYRNMPAETREKIRKIADMWDDSE